MFVVVVVGSCFSCFSAASVVVVAVVVCSSSVYGGLNFAACRVAYFRFYFIYFFCLAFGCQAVQLLRKKQQQSKRFMFYVFLRLLVAATRTPSLSLKSFVIRKHIFCTPHTDTHTLAHSLPLPYACLVYIWPLSRLRNALRWSLIIRSILCLYKHESHPQRCFLWLFTNLPKCLLFVDWGRHCVKCDTAQTCFGYFFCLFPLRSAETPWKYAISITPVQGHKPHRFFSYVFCGSWLVWRVFSF